MASNLKIVWAAPALDELDAIAEWIAMDDAPAASRLVQKLLTSVSRLSAFPDSGRWVPEISERRYREVVVPPCRVIYRVEKAKVLIIHVFRSERQLDVAKLR